MRSKILIVIAVLLMALLACRLPTGTVTPQVDSGQASEQLFKGISYIRERRSSPRPHVIHVIEIDLKEKGLLPLVTPGDPNRDLPLDARTTSEFLTDFGLQVAVNGDGFTPWRSLGPLGYYPHSGDPVDVLGFAAANGQVYSQPRDNLPTLYLTKTNKALFNRPPARIQHAISGLEMLVLNGTVVPGLSNQPDPRSAIGVNRSGKKLIILVVDGRQPGYSEGLGLPEMADLLLELGAHNAMNLDGGGSTTLVVSQNGQAQVLNSPVHQGVPGRERPVANHLGFYARND